MAISLAPTDGRLRGAEMLSQPHVFGLMLQSAIELPVATSIAGRRRVHRRLLLERQTVPELQAAWRSAEATRLVDRRFPSGRRMLEIDQHPSLGYRIWAPRHGLYVVSADGVHIRCAVPHVAPWRWQRLLFAQALPVAAALQGLELFHASAVELDGSVLGMVAASGTGKTSTAAHLVSRGATFVTDDVMALEVDGEEIAVHPGAGVAGIAVDEVKSMPRAGRARLGHVLGRAGKLYVAIDVTDRALPLRRLYYLERREGPGRLRLHELDPPDSRMLLSSLFLWYLVDPERLLAHLDACARIAKSVRMFRIEIPGSVHAEQVAAFIEAHAGGQE